MIERVRLNTSTMPVQTLERAETKLIQALSEIRFVREQVENQAATPAQVARKAART